MKSQEVIEWSAMLCVLIAVLFFSGCAEKKKVSPNIRIVHYKNCKEISVDAKTKEVTLRCPQ